MFSFKGLLSLFIFIFIFGALVSPLSAYEKAYEKTAVNKIEIKTIPASKVLVTSTEGKYFQNSNKLFRRLFYYIQQNDVEMTVPVESTIDEDQGVMKFYVGSEDFDKNLQDQKQVQVIEVPERLVVSIGGRGAYSESNITAAREKLNAWLTKQEEFESIGEAYSIFWDGPFVPSFLKRYEVHIPVKRVEAKGVAKIYPPTDLGVVEMKVLPEAILINTSTQQDFFLNEEKLYLTLNQFLKDNNLIRIAPVEADWKNGVMSFYLDATRSMDDLTLPADIKDKNTKILFQKVPRRVVLSMGVEGGYTQENILNAEQALQKWLKENPQYESTGEAYAAFWDGPFIPDFMKAFEIHLPVRMKNKKN